MNPREKLFKASRRLRKKIEGLIDKKPSKPNGRLRKKTKRLHIQKLLMKNLLILIWSDKEEKSRLYKRNLQISRENCPRLMQKDEKSQVEQQVAYCDCLIKSRKLVKLNDNSRYALTRNIVIGIKIKIRSHCRNTERQQPITQVVGQSYI